MTKLPIADRPFPELDRIVLNQLCGGKKPIACSNANWVLRHADDKVYQYVVRHNTHGLASEKMRILYPPDVAINSPGKFIMLHVDARDRDVQELAAMRAEPGHVIEQQLNVRYGLNNNFDFYLYHVHHRKNMVMKLARLLSRQSRMNMSSS